MIKKTTSRWKVLPPSSLEKLVKSGSPVYVLNTSHTPSGDKGTIAINFTSDGRREYFKMPPTFIPMAISDVIPQKSLLDSRDFRTALVKGMLTLVDPTQAEDFLATNDAQDEYENLVLSEMSSKAKGIDLEAEVTKRVKVAHQVNDSAGPVQDVSAVDTVSNKVRALVEDMSSDNKTPKQVLIELRRHQTALSAADISFVMANTDDAELKKWTKTALQDAVSDVPVTTATNTSKVPKASAQTKKVKKSDSDFDFSGPESTMTAQEQAEDSKLQAKWASQQAVNGESRVSEEINKILGGKI